jgi:phage FluMu protein Com
MEEIRCKKCKRLLMKTNAILSTDIQGFNGYIELEIMCPKCKHIYIYQALNRLQGREIGDDETTIQVLKRVK